MDGAFNFSVNFTFTFTNALTPSPTEPTSYFKLTTSDRALLGTFFILLGMGGFLHCSTLSYAILRHKTLITRPNLLLLDLLLSDTLFVFLQAPIGLFTLRDTLPPLSTKMLMFCDIYLFLSYALAITNILALSLISVDRYLSVAFPYFYEKHFRRAYFVGLCLWPWIQSFVIMLPVTFVNNWVSYGGRPDFLCSFKWSLANKVYLALALLLCFFIPLLLLTTTNIYVHRIAARHIRELSKTACQQKKNELDLTSSRNRAEENISVVSTAQETPNLDPSKLQVLEVSDLEHPRRSSEGDFFHQKGIHGSSDLSSGHRHSVPNMAASEEQITPNFWSNSSLHVQDSGHTWYNKLRERAVSIVSLGFKREDYEKDIHYLQKQRKITFSTYFLILGFILCWVPVIVVNILSIFRKVEGRAVVYSSLSPLLIATVDPVIILLSRREIRKAYRNTMKASSGRLFLMLQRSKSRSDQTT